MVYRRLIATAAGTRQRTQEGEVIFFYLRQNATAADPAVQLEELERTLASLTNSNVDGLITLADPFFTAHRGGAPSDNATTKIAISSRPKTVIVFCGQHR